MGGVDVDEAEDKAEAEGAGAAASPAVAESREAAAEVVFSADRWELERKRRRIIEGGWDCVRAGGAHDGWSSVKADDERACG